MARIEQCRVWNHAKQHRLVSNIPAYEYQILYVIEKCKGHTQKGETISLCTEPHMQWRGEFPSGDLTQFFDIAPHNFDAWKRRTETDDAKPEAQLMSQWSENIGKPADIASIYHARIDAAKAWWCGVRVKN